MSMRIGSIEIAEQLDRDEELEVSIGNDAYAYLTLSQTEELRDHLTAVLNKQTGGGV